MNKNNKDDDNEKKKKKKKTFFQNRFMKRVKTNKSNTTRTLK